MNSDHDAALVGTRGVSGTYFMATSSFDVPVAYAYRLGFMHMTTVSELRHKSSHIPSAASTPRSVSIDRRQVKRTDYKKAYHHLEL